MNDKIKYIIYVIGGFIATTTKQYGLMLLFVVIGIVFDNEKLMKSRGVKTA